MSAIDDVKLAELLAIFGAGDLVVVLDAFIDEVEQVVVGLERLMSDGPDRVRDQQLDYLARAAANMAAAEFTGTCRAFEGAAAFDMADYDRLRSAFRQMCDDFNVRLRDLRSDAA